jgi:hypothetical protein
MWCFSSVSAGYMCILHPCSDAVKLCSFYTLLWLMVCSQMHIWWAASKSIAVCSSPTPKSLPPVWLKTDKLLSFRWRPVSMMTRNPYSRILLCVTLLVKSICCRDKDTSCLVYTTAWKEVLHEHVWVSLQHVGTGRRLNRIGYIYNYDITVYTTTW